MLCLNNIVKKYITGTQTVTALNGVSLSFRKNEFVSILGQSGCGKTTMLNIVGGLDRYDEGDLVIGGKSTKQFKDADWDDYRNRRVGFVFQNYNLIPHQSVLSNVELALTLSGVSKRERRARAKAALEKVGLGDQLRKKPNQMSGGQMQRVAIARALVNDPEILLADEPTGALDSETSVQIMGLLKEVASDRLVIMVTHNPELADEYSTRIIRLLDGRVISDSNPYTEEQVEAPKKDKKKSKKHTSMSFLTALSLSFNNLLTKKARTIMTSFAGSIGIIGIALIMSVSTGVQSYIDGIEKSTMASYPITISETAMDTTAMMASFMLTNNQDGVEQQPERVYSNNVMVQMMETMTEGITSNNLKDFKEYLDNNKELKEYVSDIKYTYIPKLNVYKKNDDGSYRKGLSDMFDLYSAIGMDMGSTPQQTGAMMANASSVWTELVGDDDYIADNYNVLYGKLPKKATDVVLIIDENSQVTDYMLYSLGVCDTEDLKEYFKSAQLALQTGTENEYKIKSPESYSFKELCELEFCVLTDADYYSYNEKTGRITECDEIAVNEKLDNATRLNVVGIVTPKEESATASIGTIGYTAALMEQLIYDVNKNPAVEAQLADEKTDLFTGLAFGKKEYTADEVRAYISADPAMAQYAAMPDAMLVKYAASFMGTDATYESNLSKLGYVNRQKPQNINIYPKDFEAKDKISDIIEEYNNKASEADRITYTDTVAMLMSSVTTIVNAISYVLIAFVAISLIVSSIMIGIITYISVLERTKEIGILRSIGASKRDISNVFNAETTIVGLCAGVMGIAITLLLLIPINAILHSVTGIETLSAVLPWQGSISLIAISVVLTLIAGLIPSGVAAKRDPVEALRSE